MNDGLLVAMVSVVGSAITVVANTALNMWGKWVDSNQKTNEHKLSIRSAYINKKIEAGQEFIGKNNVQINRALYLQQHFSHLKFEKKKNKDLLKRLNDATDTLTDSSLRTDSYVLLYFDINEINQRKFDIINELNTSMVKVNDLTKNLDNGEIQFSQEAEAEIDTLLSIGKRLQSVLLETNDFVRNNLAKYDTFH